MADLEKRDGSTRPVQIRDFIFVRELSEVYLLLDFISGRWDKGLEPDVQMLIKEICEIGWPPEDGPATQAHQAAILLQAKDKLNAAAKPANGATIAFTLLVVGEDDPRQRKCRGQHADRRGTAARSGERTGQAARGSGRRAVADGDTGDWTPLPALGGPSGPGGLGGDGRRAGEQGEDGSGGAGGGKRDGGGWPGRRAGGSNGDLIAPGGGFTRPPTRMSLARTAFPGLIGPAGKFSRGIWRIVVGLVIWLVFTCLLSWNVTAGNVILTHLDTLRTQQRELTAKVSGAEAKLAADELARPAKAAPQAGAGQGPVRPR